MEFNGERLRLVRQFAELTQVELADTVAVSQAAIAQYERGRTEPTSEILDALAVSLGVVPEFFHTHADEAFAEEEYNFRRRATTTERLKKKVTAQAGLFVIVVRWLRQYTPLPPLNLPSIASGIDIEQAAEAARLHWGLGTDGPIDSMVRVLENAGIVTVIADEETSTKVDAFSRFGDTSVVVLNQAKGTASRSFFDAAHEAAHGVLHSRAPRKPYEVREQEADSFAGAFLLPRKQLARELWGRSTIDWNNLLDIKGRWNVSLQAILYRAHEQGLINTAVYRQAFRYLSRRGWRTAEPGEAEADQPELFQAQLNATAKKLGKGSAAIAADLHMSSNLFRAVTGVEVSSSTSSVTSLADYRMRG